MIACLHILIVNSCTQREAWQHPPLVAQDVLVFILLLYSSILRFFTTPGKLLGEPLILFWPEAFRIPCLIGFFAGNFDANGKPNSRRSPAFTLLAAQPYCIFDGRKIYIIVSLLPVREGLPLTKRRPADSLPRLLEFVEHEAVGIDGLDTSTKQRNVSSRLLSPLFWVLVFRVVVCWGTRFFGVGSVCFCLNLFLIIY